MKILIGFYNDNLRAGGAEGVLRQIAEYYLERGDEVHILIQQSKQYGHWEGMDYDNLRLYYGGGLVRRLKNILRLNQIPFDYSYSSIVRVTGPLGIMKRLRLLHIRTMVGRESTSIFARYKGWRLWYYKIWYKLGYKSVNMLICQTSFMKQQLLEHQPWLEKYMQVVVIPNPVSVAKMEKMGREKIDATELRPYIVTAGRFIPEKAYDVLIDAIVDVVQKRPKMKLLILGEGTLRRQIEAQIKRLGLVDNVVLKGYVDNVYPWFRNAALCVVSSRLEGFPNVLLQMMSQNNRVVSTLCAGDIDKIKGLTTCRPNDAKALCMAIQTTLDKDANKNRELFDMELESRSIVNFIKKIENNII